MLKRGLLLSFEGVSADGRAVSRIELNRKIWTATLCIGDDGTSSNNASIGGIVGGVISTDQINAVLSKLIKTVYLRLNSKDQRVCTAVQLNQLNGINGNDYLAIASGTPGQPDFRIYLTLYFAEPWRKDNSQVPALALNLNKRNGPVDPTTGKAFGDIDSCQIAVDLQPGLNGLSLTGYYTYTPVDPSRGIGSICKWISDDLQAVGVKNDHNLPMVQLVQSIHLWPTVEAVPKFVQYLSLRASGEYVQDRFSYLDIQSLNFQFGMQPDTGNVPRMDWIADMEDPVTSALIAASQTSLVMSTEYSGAAAGNMPMIIQRIGAPD